MVDQKVFLCKNKSVYANEFWTGRAWTSFMQFARKYDFHDALAILRKRFANKYPQPLIVKHSFFVEKLEAIRKAAAAKRAREQAKKLAEKLARKNL